VEGIGRSDGFNVFLGPKNASLLNLFNFDLGDEHMEVHVRNIMQTGEFVLRYG